MVLAINSILNLPRNVKALLIQSFDGFINVSTVENLSFES